MLWAASTANIRYDSSGSPVINSASDYLAYQAEREKLVSSSSTNRMVIDGVVHINNKDTGFILNDNIQEITNKYHTNFDNWNNYNSDYPSWDQQHRYNKFLNEKGKNTGCPAVAVASCIRYNNQDTSYCDYSPNEIPWAGMVLSFPTPVAERYGKFEHLSVEEFYERVFNELDNDKACVIKLDNGKGGTHWATVIGYEAGINDYVENSDGTNNKDEIFNKLIILDPGKNKGILCVDETNYKIWDYDSCDMIIINQCERTD